MTQYGNRLRQNLAHIGFILHDMGGSGSCFFKSDQSHQLFGVTHLHLEIRMVGINPEPRGLNIESMSNDNLMIVFRLEKRLNEMPVPGTCFDHLIIQVDAKAFNCTIHVTESNFNSTQGIIINLVLQQVQKTIFIGYIINDQHYVSIFADRHSQNIQRLKYLKRKCQYDKVEFVVKTRVDFQKQIHKENPEKSQGQLAKKTANYRR